VIRCVESMSIAFHRVLRGEASDRYFLVPVNYTGFDVVSVHLPAFRIGTLVAFGAVRVSISIRYACKM